MKLTPEQAKALRDVAGAFGLHEHSAYVALLVAAEYLSRPGSTDAWTHYGTIACGELAALHEEEET